jgi:hypothetical protein
MKIQGIHTTRVPIEVNVTPVEVLKLLEAEATRKYNALLESRRATPKGGPPNGYAFFYVKEGALRGYCEEGRHPRNTEWDDAIPSKGEPDTMIDVLNALETLRKYFAA